MAGDCNSLAETHAWFDSRVAHQSLTGLRNHGFSGSDRSKRPIFGTFGGVFGTDMQTKPRFLLAERGRYFYQRKVPQHLQTALGCKKWRAPLGADFDEACDRLRDLRSEHDALIAKLEDPDARQDAMTATRRQAEVKQQAEWDAEDRAYDAAQHAIGDTTETEDYLEAEAGALASGAIELEPPHERAARWIKAIDHERANPEERVLHPHPMDDDEYHDRLTAVFAENFGPDAPPPPSNPEDRDDYDAVKLKLERKISRVARNPHTVSKVAEKFFRFAEVKAKTEHKYRRTINRLVEDIGDVPVNQVTSRMLRDYRDKLLARGLLPASVHAEFAPIKGLFNYAADEELIEDAPTLSVRMPKERRAVEESKWLPFTPDEMRRIFQGMEDVWGGDVQGLSAARRSALTMAVRVLAFTAMRPAELMALRPDQVDDRAIRVEGGKTKSSWRVIPLHPEIADFPAWLHAGGLDVFANGETGQRQTDPVTPLRHNFAQLIRKKMTPQISEPRKALYSLRSTFQNAMRRAGAPKDVRRAILGHVESGAIRHYDDGPSFELLRKWVEKSDPRN